MLESNQDFRARDREVFTCSDKERNTFPSRRVNMEPHRRKSFCFGIRLNGFFIQVTGVLAFYYVLTSERSYGFEHPYFFIPDRFTVEGFGRLHGQVAKDLEQVVLNHITDSSGHIVKCPSALDPKILRHGDLHGFDMIFVPNGFEQRVDKTKEDQIVDRSFAQIVVDSIDGTF